ncbi:MAG: tRNA preQ1(34) S-adenosylmethionine ribosyltransferase-isomerase QueA [Spirochaetales bacterium]|nr:tRNA preQ1(34) S-adenosylmethionine ribosyltransferase-isomerase QueA [Spirochaetales bacterium]
MKTRDFSFNLPEELIAQYPPDVRGTARLLVVNRKKNTLIHSSMSNIGEFIDPGTLMVFNDSRVRKARLFAQSRNGGKVELLLTRQIDEITWEALTSKTRKQKIGKRLALPDDIEAEIVGVDGVFRHLRFSRSIDEDWLDSFGHIPLPPYIERPDKPVDAERYQTVYSKDTGSVAAPTAGLHFTTGLMNDLVKAGIETAFVTLHVGAGTFFPIRSENLEEHEMHREYYQISEKNAALINNALSENRRILAVGTTSIRCIESSCVDGKVAAGLGHTNLFITPGYKFSAVSKVFTNFHTPDSTLVVLVSAFAGQELIQRAYSEAIAERYNFFSYGDAMLIL